MKTFKEFLEENTLLSFDKDIRRFEFEKDKLSYEEAEKRLKEFLEKYNDNFNKSLKEYTKVIKQQLKGFTNPKFLYQFKTVSSIISKVVNRKKSIFNISDLIRGAVLLKTQDDVNNFVINFRRKNSNIIQKYEEKEKGIDKTYGYYGSHHFSLNINDLTCELQVMTQKLWNYKEEAHKIYQQTRDKGEVTKQDMELSKKIFNIGNLRRESIEEHIIEYTEYFEEILK